MPIKLLPARLANQIAAGEVVERPASVVKELIENSLDAGATRIELEIEKGGHKRIRIRDNGSGIPKDELELALSRHATSKIATLDDLEHILSLGFRGEALASISSVSRLTLTSKPEAQEQAWQAYCEGRDMGVALAPAAHPVGTTIDVADLFYNTPARRKFLRTEKTEFQHIEDVFKRIALSRPEIALVLKHNGKQIKRYAGHKGDKSVALGQRVAAVCGKKFIDNATFLETEYQDLKIYAWLGNSATLRSSNDMQFSFVNGRGMRDKLITHAIRQAYESVLASAEQPAFVFYLDIDPGEVDVNVHPAKHEVRFHQGRLVHDFICKSVCDALAQCEGDSQWQDDEEEPTHDYIRPLTSSPSHQAFDGTGHSGHKIMDTHARESNDTGMRTTPSHRPAGSSGNQIARGAKPVSADYQANYQRLMKVEDGETGPISNELGFISINLNPKSRIYVYNEIAILLKAKALLCDWLADKLSQAGPSQPLLMPVMLAAEAPSAPVSALFQSMGFGVQHVAGKCRLLQVPGGTRHFPWVRLFELMLNAQPTDNSGLIAALASQPALWEDAIDHDIWYWLDSQPSGQQWQKIEENGAPKALSEIIDWWSVSE